PRHPGGDGPAAHLAALARHRALGCARARRDVGRPDARLLLRLPGRLLHHVPLLRPLRPRPRRPPARRLMLEQEFMRNALVAGTVVGLAGGWGGSFVVRRAQVFAGAALGHVAFTGALAAAVIGLDLRAGLFVATVAGALLLAVLGDRAHADDVVIGTVFAFALGLGVLFLSIFTTSSSAGNGSAGVRVLFGSIYGLDRRQVVTSAMLALLA